jgi:cytoskeletal protein RodZ
VPYYGEEKGNCQGAKNRERKRATAATIKLETPSALAEGEIAVRLTLRTLLAYLDDTLEPLEIKTIGQKVSESETAQELIARIKQVTRRRRITTPPATGPNSFEPNMVADYLDSQLSSEQVAELEKICLESDVHLAEVASCHQILTLVLGEPATVPPTAKERMYGLVRGREAIPFRKAATANGHEAAVSADHADADETFLLGLPFYRRGSWLRWALPLAAVLLFAIVGIALWQSMFGLTTTPPTPTPRQVAQVQPANPETKENNDQTPKNDTASTTKKPLEDQPKAPDKATTKPPDEKTQTPSTKANAEISKPDKNTPAEKPTEKPAEIKTEKPTERKTESDSPTFASHEDASKERVEIGTYVTPDFKPPSLLVSWTSDKWQRAKPGGGVYSRDPLVSLPGYLSEIRLPCGVHLELFGHLREFTPQAQRGGLMDHLQECALVLNKPPKGVDVDVTLDRGRLFVSNHNRKEPGRRVVRLRFDKNQIWDLFLQPDAEAVVDLFKHQIGNFPITTLNLCPLEGNVGISLEGEYFPTLEIPGHSYFKWDSVHPPHSYGRDSITKKWLENAKNTIYAKKPPTKADNAEEVSGMERALAALRKLMKLDEAPSVTLTGVLKKEGVKYPYEHRLAIYCLGAMDEIGDLLNLLSEGDLPNSPDRWYAFLALRRWLDRGPEQMLKLYDPEKRKGILTEASYTPGQAERIATLLRDPSADEIFNSKEYYEALAEDLTSEKVIVAELASWRLKLLTKMFHLELSKLSKFNAAVPSSARKPARDEVEAKIREGLLPPPDPNRPPPGPGGRTPQDNRPKKK